MRSGVLKLALFGLIAAWSVLAITAAAADAAKPTQYELPDATHAHSLAPAPDGTVWFVPSRGNHWVGENRSILGSVTPGGTVVELEVAGFGAINRVAVAPQGEIWISGKSGTYGDESFEVARVSPTGKLERLYSVGHADGPYLSSVRLLSATTSAIWFVRQRSSRPESIERLDPATGGVRRFTLRPRCHATALQPAPDGTLWFAEKCGSYVSRGPSTPTKASIGRIEPSGTIIRRPIIAADYPAALAIGPNGTIWFGATRRYDQPNRVGLLTKDGEVAEFPVPDGMPSSIAVGPDGHLWFQSALGGRGAYRALNSIGVDGELGTPICADPGCQLEPDALTSASDGSLWYGLRRPNLNRGGGGSGLFIGEEIDNEAGFIAHLIPAP
jgi:streptogramin lyase